MDPLPTIASDGANSPIREPGQCNWGILSRLTGCAVIGLNSPLQRRSTSSRMRNSPQSKAGETNRRLPPRHSEKRSDEGTECVCGYDRTEFADIVHVSTTQLSFEGDMNLRARFLLLLLPFFPSAALAGPDIHDTRLLTEPAISADRIAFIYAGDLWTCGLDGGNVRRLTSDVGFESSPAFSPDGKWIAFSAQYEGNTDVYLVSADGGVPKRLTWHPGNDVVQGFTPDGKSVVFTSPRAVYTGRYTQLFSVPVEGGPEQRLAIPNANRAVFSADGRRIAYNPGSPQFLQWKRYRGGAVSQVWLYDVASHAIEKVPQPATRANDAGPMWIGDTVYFRSDREGEFNLYSWDAKSKSIKRVTNHSDFPVANASAGGGRIVYEQAGYLHLFDPATGTSKKLTIGVAADLPETRPRFVKE